LRGWGLISKGLEELEIGNLEVGEVRDCKGKAGELATAGCNVKIGCSKLERRGWRLTTDGCNMGIGG
jgi:hypothetical protein